MFCVPSCFVRGSSHGAGGGGVLSKSARWSKAAVILANTLVSLLHLAAARLLIRLIHPMFRTFRQFDSIRYETLTSRGPSNGNTSSFDAGTSERHSPSFLLLCAQESGCNVACILVYTLAAPDGIHTGATETLSLCSLSGGD